VVHADLVQAGERQHGERLHAALEVDRTVPVRHLAPRLAEPPGAGVEVDLQFDPGALGATLQRGEPLLGCGQVGFASGEPGGGELVDQVAVAGEVRGDVRAAPPGQSRR
jgi:hypothetical protein